ncbi:MAG: cupin domain-containing protein [Gammaproteobacteria bacterium]|nr:cupin domain-containing protein [Gammaproteobacteria bacterium]
MLTRYKNIKPFITRDGSEIRELMHPMQHGNTQQSLAEATVMPGGETLKHKHLVTEEIYHITQGQGLMSLGEQLIEVSVGDSICIAPGTAHNIRNTGDIPLKILCSCSPPYRDADTLLLESQSPTNELI